MTSEIATQSCRKLLLSDVYRLVFTLPPNIIVGQDIRKLAHSIEEDMWWRGVEFLNSNPNNGHIILYPNGAHYGTTWTLVRTNIANIYWQHTISIYPKFMHHIDLIDAE